MSLLSHQRPGFGLELCMSNSYYFTNASLDDVVLHPFYSQQKIHIGVNKNVLSSLTIDSNSVMINAALRMNSNLYVDGSFGVNTSNPEFNVDVNGDVRGNNIFAQSSIGINTIDPKYNLDVVGDACIQNLTVKSNVCIGKTTSLYPLDVNGTLHATCLLGSTLGLNTTPMYTADVNGDLRSCNVYVLNSLGIGTTVPSSKLEVVGNTKTTALYASNVGINTLTPTYHLDVDGDSRTNSIYVNSNIGVNTLQPEYPIDVNGDTRTINMYVTERLGINTIFPEYPIDVIGPGRIQNVYCDSLGVQNTQPEYPVDVSGSLRANEVYVTNKIGVGTLQPTSELDVVGSINASSIVLASNIGVNTSNPQAHLDVNGTCRATTMYVGNSIGSPAYNLDVNGTSRTTNIYVTNAIGVGTTTPTHNLQVEGDAFFNGPVTTTQYIETSGADYGEYMKKGSVHMEFHEGDIVGITQEGQLTDIYDNAISFGIKSSSPGMIGGNPPTWTEKYMYDVIAYCGRVPVRLGRLEYSLAMPGDYIIPCRDEETGKIYGCACNAKSMSLEMYLLSVGKILRYLDNSMVEVLVKMV